MIADRFDNMYLTPLRHLKRAGRDVSVLRASQRRAGQMDPDHRRR